MYTPPQEEPKVRAKLAANFWTLVRRRYGRAWIKPVLSHDPAELERSFPAHECLPGKPKSLPHAEEPNFLEFCPTIPWQLQLNEGYFVGKASGAVLNSERMEVVTI